MSKKIIRQILLTEPIARDDKKVLYTLYLFDKGYNSFKLTIHDLHKLQRDKKVMIEESVARISREIQEKNYWLRGENWYKRKGIAEIVRFERGRK